MVEYLKSRGYEADLLDMPTRNTADWKEALLGYDALISAGEKIPGETMRFLRGSLKVISRFGVGTDEMDHAEAVRQGIAICNAAGSFNRPVAECALGMMICLLRNIHLGNREVHSCDWSRFNESRNGEQLYGKTVGLIGFGGIAQTLARMLMGFDCHVIACDPFFNEEAAEKWNVKRVEMDELVRSGDVVCLLCPLTDETRDMVDAEFLRRMKKNAVLINTSRGGLINEYDLADALKKGVIAAAGLDVLRQEPVTPKCPLLGLDNCLLEPHIGANTNDAVEYAGMFAARNAADFLDGKKVATILNPDYVKNTRGIICC
ncbi:MAG: 3-phosphoglycerate dehydrogenase [Clostridia bacterium]|nr:3-phosphoglycerate dehydrogenase [Clostridia bacterium]